MGLFGGKQDIDSLRDKLRNSTNLNMLMKYINNEDWRIRVTVVDSLGKISGDSRAVELLIDVLKNDPHSGVKGRAANSLGKIGDTTAISPLISVLQSNDSWGPKSAAASALGEIGDKSAIPFLVFALQDKEFSVRLSSAEALGEIGDMRAVEPLVAASQDEHFQVRENAGKALAKIRGSDDPELQVIYAISSRDYKKAASCGESAVDPLISELARSKKYSAESKRIEDAIEEIGNEGIKELAEILSDENANKRECAADMLGHFRDVSTIEPLCKALKDKDQTVRRAAANAITVIIRFNNGGNRASSHFKVALKDSYDAVRCSAAEGLGLMKDKSNVDSLIEALNDESSRVVGSAAYALGAIGDNRAVNPLCAKLLAGRSVACAMALGQLKDPNAVNPLIEAIKTSEERHIRGGLVTKCVVALGEIGDPKAIEILNEALDSASRNEATIALSKIGTPTNR